MNYKCKEFRNNLIFFKVTDDKEETEDKGKETMTSIISNSNIY